MPNVVCHCQSKQKLRLGHGDTPTIFKFYLEVEGQRRIGIMDIHVHDHNLIMVSQCQPKELLTGYETSEKPCKIDVKAQRRTCIGLHPYARVSQCQTKKGGRTRICTDRRTDRHTYRHTERQTDKTYGRTDRQTE